MDRSATSYLVLHYTLLIGLILLVVETIERTGTSVPLWMGVIVALVVGFGYPRVVAAAGVAPERWES
ncbi:hypothetical protein [Halorarum salinum]|uniref:Uncharacterized protein n=1 Tax=Halorarum salinum TaxID=2743089 RepID=A0A7D5QBF0_9EURY|nr:hypothetical protein [Halobaculum salinum]QLG61740.1 hypothetical protein HUG12_08365 [Halobaculum salinum]